MKDANVGGSLGVRRRVRVKFGLRGVTISIWIGVGFVWDVAYRKTCFFP